MAASVEGFTYDELRVKYTEAMHLLEEMTADRDQLADTVINLETALMDAPRTAQPSKSNQEDSIQTSATILLAEHLVGELQKIQQSMEDGVAAWRVSEQENEFLCTECLRKEDEIVRLRKLLDSRELELAQAREAVQLTNPETDGSAATPAPTPLPKSNPSPVTPTTSACHRGGAHSSRKSAVDPQQQDENEVSGRTQAPTTPTFKERESVIIGDYADEAAHTPLKWEELRNIQAGEKWFKVPDVAQLSAAASKARSALKEAQAELLRSSRTPSKYREPWQPPSIGKLATSAPQASSQSSNST